MRIGICLDKRRTGDSHSTKRLRLKQAVLAQSSKRMMLIQSCGEIVVKASGEPIMQSAHSHSQTTALSQRSSPSQIEVTRGERPSGEFLAFFIPFVVFGTIFAANAVVQLVTDQAKDIIFVCIWAVACSYITLGTCSGFGFLVLFKICRFVHKSFQATRRR